MTNKNNNTLQLEIKTPQTTYTLQIEYAPNAKPTKTEKENHIKTLKEQIPKHQGRINRGVEFNLALDPSEWGSFFIPIPRNRNGQPYNVIIGEIYKKKGTDYSPIHRVRKRHEEAYKRS